MTRTVLERRLINLEEARSGVRLTQQPAMAGARLLSLLLAVHLGGRTHSESIGEAEARALGYASGGDYRAALQAAEEPGTLADLNSRRADAVTRLLALKGVEPDDGPAMRDALRSLFDELPVNDREGPAAQRVGAEIGEALDLLCA